MVKKTKRQRAYVAHYLKKKVEEMVSRPANKRSPIKTWSRRSMITDSFIGLMLEF